MNAFVNAFLAGSRFFLPIILYVVYAWCCPSFSLCYLFLHFFKDDVELINLADLLIQLCSYLFHPWHIWGSFLTLSPRFLSKTTNFSIYAISLSSASSPSSVLKNPIWSRWKMILSCFLLHFSSHFARFIFLYRSLSNHCSLGFLRL